MAPESLSDQIVNAASIVFGAACLAMVCGVFTAWRQSRPKNRAKTKLTEMSLTTRAVMDSLVLERTDQDGREATLGLSPRDDDMFGQERKGSTRSHSGTRRQPELTESSGIRRSVVMLTALRES